MPNAPKTPARQMRIPDDEWDGYDEATKAMGSDRAKVTRDFIRWYLRQAGAKPPVRPTAKQIAEITQERQDGSE